MPPEVNRKGNLVVTVRMTLQPGRDDDLIALVLAAPHRCLAGIVREAMRSGVSRKVVAVTEMAEEPLDMTGLGMEL